MAPLDNVKEFRAQQLISHAMAKLDERMFSSLVRRAMEQGTGSLSIIEEATTGMSRVGDLYKSGQYFLADLIVAAEMFKEMLDLVLKEGTLRPPPDFPPIIFGTVEGDIHDIGKNITIGVLRGNGLEVVDLGVNVPSQAFVDAVQETGSPLLCLSGLITPAYDGMKKTVRLLEREGLRTGVTVVIGGLVNEAVRNHTGADYWVTDCAAGRDLCESILRGKNAKTVLSL